MSRLPLLPVLHAWLLSALAELQSWRHHLLRGVSPCLSCAGLCRETLGACSSQMDGEVPPALAVQDQAIGICYVETQGRVVRRSTPATAQIQTSCLLPCGVDLFAPNIRLCRTQTRPGLGYPRHAPAQGLCLLSGSPPGAAKAEASWAGVTGLLMTGGLKSDAMKWQGWKCWKKSLKNSKRGGLQG